MENQTPNITKISFEEIELQKFKDEIEPLINSPSVALAIKVIKTNEDLNNN